MGTYNFLKYGKPLAAAAPIMLGLIGLPAPAHACTGNADDPEHCINNGQTINGFSNFFFDNLEGVPGTDTVPGSNDDPGSLFMQAFLKSFDERGGNAVAPLDPGDEFDFTDDIDIRFTLSGTADNGLTFDGPVNLLPGEGSTNAGDDVDVFLSGNFGTITMGDTDGAFDWALRDIGGDFREDVDVDVQFDFQGVADNGLRYGFQLDLRDADPAEGGGVSGRTGDLGLYYDNDFLRGGSFGGGSTGGVDVRPDEEFQFRPSITLDNGLRIGVDIQLEGENSGDQIDESFLFIRGSFGEILLGSENTAGYVMSYGAPDTSFLSVNSPEQADFIPYSGPNLEAAQNGILRPQITLDNGLTFAVDLESGIGAAGGNTDDGPEFRYFTPRFAGYQIQTDQDGTAGSGDFDVGSSYVNSFGGLTPKLQARWGVADASLNFAVGSASVGNYGSLEGVNIDKFDYIPLDLGATYTYDTERVGAGIRINYGAVGGTGQSAPTPQPVQIQSPPVTGEQVGESAFNNSGDHRNINIIRTEDGKLHGVDAETGHDYGTMHESSSGFGWSFDNAPIQPPAELSEGTSASPNPLSQADVGTVFSDGFESGDTTSWTYNPSF